MKNARKQRDAKRLYAKQLFNQFKPSFVCVNCEESTQWGHFAPPSFGEEGFFICEKKESVNN